MYVCLGSGDGVGSGAGGETTAREFVDGIRITRAPGLAVIGPESVSALCADGLRKPFRAARFVVEEFLRGSSPAAMGWCIAFPRAMQLMLSTSFCMGLKSRFQTAMTSSIDGGGDWKPFSSQKLSMPSQYKNREEI